MIRVTDSKITYQNIDWQQHIKGCARNDRKSQEFLYRHFFPIMERMVLRYTQDEDQLIDILNNGFLKVFQKIESYSGKGSFEGWIRRIIYHSISDYFRAGQKDLKFLIFENEYSKEPEEKQENKLYYQELISLVNKLPEMHMKIFHLYAIEGYSHKEISEQLNINSSTCRWYLSEARKQLQKEYSKMFLSDYNETG